MNFHMWHATRPWAHKKHSLWPLLPHWLTFPWTTSSHDLHVFHSFKPSEGFHPLEYGNSTPLWSIPDKISLGTWEVEDRVLFHNTNDGTSVWLVDFTSFLHRVSLLDKFRSWLCLSLYYSPPYLVFGFLGIISSTYLLILTLKFTIKLFSLVVSHSWPPFFHSSMNEIKIIILISIFLCYVPILLV